MRIISGRLRGTRRLARVPELSQQARRRLKWMDYYREGGGNARLTCRHFDISPQTFYRWKRRYNPGDLKSLEGRARRPRRLRKPTWSPELSQAVLHLREQYPRWGKDKLVVLLRQQGWEVSTSMVGRILKRLKERGVLKEPPRNGVATSKHQHPRPYAIRKPRDYRVEKPGDLIQVDTLDVRPVPGVIFKHFTARDMVSRWDVVEAHRQATATTAAHFLDTLEQRLPFPPRALQVDGGSEFAALFETECQRRSIRLFVLPPRSPKLNGCVERAHRTHTEEFYQVEDFPLDMADLNQSLRVWERTYNTIRPHQALGYLTPQQYLLQCQQERRMCH
jgi:putative transposase